MDTIFLNSGNSKTSDAYRLLLNINLKRAYPSYILNMEKYKKVR